MRQRKVAKVAKGRKVARVAKGGNVEELYEPLEGFWGKAPVERRRLITRFEEVLLTELRLWKDNPRINEAAVPKLAKLIQEHGFVGIVIATPDGIIRRGNTRYKALRALGREKVWVEWRNFASKQAARDFALADNKAAEWADWDHAKLAKMFKERATIDMVRLQKATGFAKQEIEWQGAPELDVDAIDDFEDEEAKFVIRIQDVRASEKDEILASIKNALEGTEYEARAY